MRERCKHLRYLDTLLNGFDARSDSGQPGRKEQDSEKDALLRDCCSMRKADIDEADKAEQCKSQKRKDGDKLRSLALRSFNDSSSFTSVEPSPAKRRKIEASKKLELREREIALREQQMQLDEEARQARLASEEAKAQREEERHAQTMQLFSALIGKLN